MSERLDFSGDGFDETEQAPDIMVTTDGVRDYLKQIGRTPLLSAEQEVTFARQIEAGLIASDVLEARAGDDTEAFRRLAEKYDMTDEELAIDLETLSRLGEGAQSQMVQANLRLVVSVAKRYLSRGLEFQDLISEGNVGLVHAVEKFDYQKGFKFSTYATWWIRQAITRAIADKSRAVRIPVHVHEKMMKLTKTTAKLAADLGRQPTDEELAKELNLTTKKVAELREHRHSIMSLDMPLGEDGDVTIGDLVQDDNADSFDATIFDGQLAQALAEQLDGLEPRQAEIIKRRYGLDGHKQMTLEEIGDYLGVTRERVRQIQNNAMKQLRKNIGELKQFWHELE